MTSPNRSPRLWLSTHKRHTSIAFLGALTFSNIYYFTHGVATSAEANALISLLHDVSPGAIVVLAGYTAASYLLWYRGFDDADAFSSQFIGAVVDEISEASRREESLSCIKSVAFRFDDSGLDRLLKAASYRVVIVGRYWTSAFSDELFEEFLRRGGRLHAVTVHPGEDRLLSIATQQRKPDPWSSQTYPIGIRLAASVNWLHNCWRRAGAPPDAISIYTLPYLPNYAAYGFDGSNLILVPYEHFFRVDSRAPRFHLDLGDDKIRRFWDHEVQHLLDPGNRVDIEGAVELFDCYQES